ncbi:hypothetical protein IWW47_002284, partial [Coemansia sp. RSA 2052]
MSSGALSFAPNPATAIDQDMSDLVIAAATAAAAVSQSESSLSPTSVGASTSPSPTIPPGFVSAIIRDDDEQLDGNKSADGDAANVKDMDAAVTADTLQQSASVTPEQQSLPAPADDPATAVEAADVAGAELASSLLLKPFAGMPSQDAKSNSAAIASMAGSQELGNGGADTCFSPLDMLIAALDPQKSQHMAAVATPQPA